MRKLLKSNSLTGRPKLRKMTDTVTLRSSDGQDFKVQRRYATESATIRHFIEDDASADFVPLPNVKGATLARVIKFLAHDVDEAKGESEAVARAWNARYCSEMDHVTLFEVVLAANYLNCRTLLDVVCKHVASMLKDKTPQQIRETFNIKNDFTPEEEAEVIRENQWAFD